MDTSKITVNTLSNALGYYVIREKENVTVQRGLKSRHIHTMQYHEPVSATCEKQEQWHTTVAADVGNCIVMNREYQSLKKVLLQYRHWVMHGRVITQ